MGMPMRKENEEEKKQLETVTALRLNLRAASRRYDNPHRTYKHLKLMQEINSKKLIRRLTPIRRFYFFCSALIVCGTHTCLCM